MPQTTFVLGDKSWSVDADQNVSLLDRALSGGVPIAYSCRKGDCGQCTGTLLHGQLQAVDSATAVQGPEALLCRVTACENVTVALPYAPELEGIEVRRSPCKIQQLRALSSGVLEVTLRLPPHPGMRYLPGQFIRLTNKQGLTRSYSLAQGPAADGMLRIQVQRVENGGFSAYLFEQAQANDLLHLEGPFGRFFVRDSASVDKTIFLATGTGIAPIYAIVSSLGEAQSKRCGELHLYWGNQGPDNAYLSEALRALAASRGLKYFEVYSRAPAAQSGGEMRYVQHLMAEHHADLSAAQVFASGNVGMVEQSRQMSLARGLPLSQFHSDPFTAS